MAIKNVAQEVKKKINEMIQTKEKELSEINIKREEYLSKKEEAEKAIETATEVMDVEAYEEAKVAMKKAETALDMYSERYRQLNSQEFISEKDSDAVVDKLLAYEDDLAKKFISDIREPLESLRKITEAYREDVEEAEETIKEWGFKIHANYTTRGKMQRYDNLTGKYTDRTEEPSPVHNTPYYGCSEFVMLKKYLEDAPTYSEDEKKRL